MAKRKEEFPLEKITIKLFEGDAERFRQLHPRLSISRFVRETIRRHIRKVENEAERQRPTIADLDLDFDLETEQQDV